MNLKIRDKRTPEEIEKSKQEIEKRKHERKHEAEEAIRLSMPIRIANLRQEINEKTSEADKLEALLKLYPDIKVREHRWGKITCYSKLVNSLVSNYDVRHNCGCCSDSPLEVFPYIETPHGRVYSDPPCFTIGHQNPDTYGDDPYDNWRDNLKNSGIPDEIIEKIGYRFKKEDILSIENSEDS